jgi:hypothetical protein
MREVTVYLQPPNQRLCYPVYSAGWTQPLILLQRSATRLAAAVERIIPIDPP